MSDERAALSGPDLALDGMLASDIPDGGMVLGHAGGEAAMMVRRGTEVFALGATCAHYGGPLAEGVFDGERVVLPAFYGRSYSASSDVGGNPPGVTHDRGRSQGMIATPRRTS